MKKHWLFTTLAALTLCVMCLVLFPTEAKAADVASGTCGENLTWTLDDEGVLRISGTGKMTDYYDEVYYGSRSPWYSKKNIKAVVIGDNVTSIGNYAFPGCSSLASITIPDSVTSIGVNAFAGCSSLTSIAIPDSVTSIDYGAFQSCTSLASVIVGGRGTSIGSSAFSDCSSLTNATIRNGTICIGYSAFWGCSSLTSISIPDSVTIIGDSAYVNCSGLASVTIGNGVTSIGHSAFGGCSSLTSISIPDSVTIIGDSAYGNCSGLTSVTIGNGVTSIGDGAFSYCSNLTSVTIKGGATSVGNSAFFDCNSLASVTIGEGVTSIGDSAFYNCTKLTSIAIPNSVTNIGDSAFWGCSGLTNVTIGNGVTSIGGQAFALCSSLTSITIPDSVTSIGNYAFENCSSLTSVTIPDSVTSIGNSAFRGCSSLTGITIPDSVTSIGGSAFSGCTGLTSITIPDSVISIGDYVFSGSSGLTSVTIGGGVTSIGESAFHGCNSLITVTIGGGVTSIGRYAFSGCSGLTSVTIGDGVTSIGNYAFQYCSGLKDVYYSGTKSQWNQIVISGYNNYSLTDAIIHYQHIHDYSLIPEIVVPATCTDVGYTEYTCAYGEKYVADYVPALGHIKGTDTVVVAPTCGLHGYTQSTCQRCQEKVQTDFVDSLGHDFSGKETVVAPTCTEYGYTTIQCTSCTEITITDFVDSLGHSWVYRDEEAATCTEDGHTAGTLCSRCGFLGTASKIEKGHSYDSGVVTKPATCKETGVKTFTCSSCGSTKAESIPKLTHSYTNVITQATQTTDGKIERKCGGCGTVASTTTIKAVTSFTLSTVNYTYNGAAKKPAVTVKDSSGKTLVKGTDYTVSYSSGRTALGTYTVTIKMKGNYSGTKTLTFNINLATPNVTVSNATNGVKINWNAVAGAKSYKVYKSVYSGGKWSAWTAIKTGVTGTTYTDTSVKSNDNVRYTVKAINGSFTSNIKASSSIKYLAAPTVTVSNATNGVKITWNAVSGAKNYKVYKSVYSGGKWSAWTAIKTGVTGTTYTDTSVKSNANVKYTVRAFNGNFSSTYKSSSSIKFLATPTVKVANAAKGVTVTWNKISGAKTYTVYRSTYSGGKWSGWIAIKTGVTGTSYTDTTVKSGATVRYTVKAINGNFRSNVKTGNTTKFLAQPTVKVAKASNGIKVSWGKVTGASGYIVYRRTYSGGKWSGWTSIKTTTALSFTDTTAKKGVTYQYTVRAYSGSYKSSYTNSTSIKR